MTEVSVMLAVHRSRMEAYCKKNDKVGSYAKRRSQDNGTVGDVGI